MSKNPLQTEELSLKIYNYVSSIPFMLFLACCGGILFIFNWSILSIYFFCLVIAFELYFCRDLIVTTAPFLMMCMSLLKLYGVTAEDLAPSFLVAIPVVIALVRHFIVFKPERKFNKGEHFWQLFWVSIALTFGGLFSISVKEYFKLGALYYVFTLGFVMLALYLMFRHYIVTDNNYKPFQVLVNGMIGVGFLGFFMILTQVIPFIITKEMYYIQWQNNLSAFMFLAFPFPFYLAVKKEKLRFFFLGCMNYFTIFFTFSRGGMLFGSVAFLLCIIYCICFSRGIKRTIYSEILLFLVMIGFTILLYDKRILVWLYNTVKVNKGEARIGLFTVAIERFLENPLFGAGMGYQGEFYNPLKGGMYWYHSTPFQAIGSMGLLGVGAYAYQYFARFRCLACKKRKENFATVIMLIGFELMACVNPGDFCPLPYVLVLTEIITIIELTNSCCVGQLLKIKPYKKLFLLKKEL